ncbi:MAG: M20 family metallopeptidase [Polyangiaceae bacterium]|nr:M20 family metallopeptidase [Polyangiaceae bacterium]
MTPTHAQLDAEVDRLGPALDELSRDLHAHPELRFQEVRAAAKVAELVERAGVRVERGLAGLPTALRARVGGAGPRIAILAEYDALPELGHACGHNLIAAGAAGAFLALAAHAVALPGTVELVGTPAEEGGGGKILLLDAGVFAGVDAAMMFHPFHRDILMHTALASTWLAVTFRGTPSHAAAAPWDGASALTACLDTFRLVDGQRAHLRDGARVHGIVTDGGRAVNVVPERAAAEFSVRARDLAELARVRAVVERCARAAALASGVEVDVEVRSGYKDMRNNAALAARFGEHLATLGRAARMTAPEVGAGSTDMGDVSHAVPAIHPWIAICGADEATIHQRAFAEIAASDRGAEGMRLAAKAMARLTLDVLTDAALRAELRSEFDAR